MPGGRSSKSKWEKGENEAVCWLFVGFAGARVSLIAHVNRRWRQGERKKNRRVNVDDDDDESELKLFSTVLLAINRTLVVVVARVSRTNEAKNPILYSLRNEILTTPTIARLVTYLEQMFKKEATRKWIKVNVLNVNEKQKAKPSESEDVLVRPRWCSLFYSNDSLMSKVTHSEQRTNAKKGRVRTQMKVRGFSILMTFRPKRISKSRERLVTRFDMPMERLNTHRRGQWRKWLEVSMWTFDS